MARFSCSCNLLKFTALVGAIIFLAAPAAAQGPTLVGEVRAYSAESPHPYPRGDANRPVVWRDVIVSPDAEFVRLRFRGFALAPGDYVTVSNPDGSDHWVYEGRGLQGTGNFWSFAVEGDTAIVEIHGGPRNANGYRIDAVGHGSRRTGPPGPSTEIQCGTDGRENVACHLPEVAGLEEAVARLLFVSGASQYVCTGWLIDGSQPDTLITNSHCISRQAELDSLQASFNYQKADCPGTTDSTRADYSGGQMLITSSVDRRGSNGGLDYSLMTLQGNPEQSIVPLQATTDPAAVGDLIWFLQHPAGRPKEIGYWEDADHTVRCKVDSIEQTYGRSAGGSQTGYACDSQGGSSGSPIIYADSRKVIALHHFGGVDRNSCLNAGTSMAHICADAGSLLNCTGGTLEPPTEPPQSCGDLLPVGQSCTDSAQCCSGKCKGKPGAMTCK